MYRSGLKDLQKMETGIKKVRIKILCFKDKVEE